MGVYAKNVASFIEASLAVLPVLTIEKRPAVHGWQNATLAKSLAWAKQEKLGAADGLGVLLGEKSRIVEIDVDAVGSAWVGAAMMRFGETPVAIRTASGKAKLWYRYTSERRRIRPFANIPIDVLGKGFTIAPPSVRQDLRTNYEFLSGGLNETADLPCLKPGSLDSLQSPETTIPGLRNTRLWRWSMMEARSCDDVEALIDAAKTYNQAYPEPLSALEVEKCAKSAWRYEVEGRNFVGLQTPTIMYGDRVMDQLIDKPDAFALLAYLKRWHSNRSEFAIAPTAMSEQKSPPWSRHRIERARDILLDRGFLKELNPPIRGKRAGRYRLDRAV